MDTQKVTRNLIITSGITWVLSIIALILTYLNAIKFQGIPNFDFITILLPLIVIPLLIITLWKKEYKVASILTSILFISSLLRSHPFLMLLWILVGYYIFRIIFDQKNNLNKKKFEKV